MAINFHDKIRVHDVHQCSQQDLADISKLLSSTMFLIYTSKRNKKFARISSILCHGLAIANALYATKRIIFDGQDKLILLLYIPLIIYCAKNGFTTDAKYQQAHAEYNELSEKYNTVKNIIENAPCEQIHDIAEMYRSDIPNEDNISSDNIKKTLYHIQMRFER